MAFVQRLLVVSAAYVVIAAGSVSFALYIQAEHEKADRATTIQFLFPSMRHLVVKLSCSLAGKSPSAGQ